MEISQKLKISAKKRCKKKKKVVDETIFSPVVKPELFNGESNWLLMQKHLGISAKKTSKFDHTRNANKTYRTNNFHRYNKHFKNLKSEPAKDLTSNLNKCDSDVVLPGNSKFEEIKRKRTTSGEFPVAKMARNECKREDSQHFEFNFNGRKSKGQTASTEADLASYNLNHNASDVVESAQLPVSSTQGVRLTKAVAMDCEMVGTGPTGKDSIIARVSIVNSFGECLYDEFVKPKEKVTDYRTAISGVRPSDLQKGKDLYDVQTDVLNIIKGRILVGHAIKHDLEVLFISHPRYKLRDTSRYKPFCDLCGGRTPSLKKLTSMILGCDIQEGEHNSIEDAQATMLLYLKSKNLWEEGLRKKSRKKSNHITSTDVT